MAAKDYFRDKRIAVVGLGPHGEMITDIKFLIKSGALVALYDVRSEAKNKDEILLLREYGLAGYVCGQIPTEDLLDVDLVILSHEYPRDSHFVKAILERGIQVEYPETLFFRLAPPVTLVGVMGTCGKSTVMSLLSPMLEEACKSKPEQNLFIMDPDTDGGILAHLRKIKNGDVVLLRIIDLVMKELHAMRISPHIAVFTTLPGKGSYVKTPFEILSYQTYNNYIIGNDYVIDATHREKLSNRAKMLRTKPNIIPAEWNFKGRGHDRDNAAVALETARIFKVSEDAAREIIESWKPLKGRLEMVKKVKTVEFYNDSASVNPYSTIAGLNELSQERNLVLIIGGADTHCEYGELYAALPKHVHTIITLPGSGTLKQRPKLRELDKLKLLSAPSLEEAVRLAMENSSKGDRVLFSPAFAACGLDRSRTERGERFVRAVRSL